MHLDNKPPKTGVSGIITDFQQILKSVLDNYSDYEFRPHPGLPPFPKAEKEEGDFHWIY